jgi:hypothetical protein
MMGERRYVRDEVAGLCEMTVIVQRSRACYLGNLRAARRRLRGGERHVGTLKRNVIRRKAKHDSRILSQEHTAGLHVLQTSKLYLGLQGIL